jgi:hypothetical protein
LKISTQTISGEAGTDFGNSKTDKTEAAVSTQNAAADITTENSANSNYFSRFFITNSSNPAIEVRESHYWNYTYTENTTTHVETDEPVDTSSLSSTSVQETGAGNVSAAADDESVISPSINKTTSATTEPTGCPDPCSGQDQYGNSWTGCPGSYVSRPCPNRALGEAKWFCDSHGNSFIGNIPDYSNCTHMWIEEVREEVSNLNVNSSVLNK